MPLHLSISAEQVQRVAAARGGPVFRHWVMLMAKIDARAKQKLSNDVVHVRTGNLRSSQQMPVVAVLGGRIVGSAQNVAKYALFVHEGTKAHDVVPVNGRVLTGWVYDGAPVFTPVAHIPAQAARPWLRDAMREVIAASR